MSGKRFYVIDDQPAVVTVVKALLEQAGHEVRSSTSPLKALREIEADAPDCVVTDIMMPDMDGLELCKRLRGNPRFDTTRIVILTAKAYEFDRRRARELGADGYLVKPIDPETLVSDLERIIADTVELAFWGVRGTLPVPGRGSVRYGGNTPCVSLAVQGEPLFIFDAGSGIRELSRALFESGRAKGLSAKIFISHPHWDHIQALPFFGPLYVQGNEFEILGARHGDLSVRETVSAQMDGVYFPVTIKQFAARVYFRDLHEEELRIGKVDVRTMLLNHPGQTLGYRLEYRGRRICYVTDNEMYPPGNPHHDDGYMQRLAEFCRGADVLITDTTYSDAEYPAKTEWGHSCPSQVAELATRAGAGVLHIFHHDPGQSDDDIDRKLEETQRHLERLGSPTRAVCPVEGQTVLL